MYPDAQVLLTVREPERWYESMMQTVYPASQAGLSAPAGSVPGRAARVIDTLAWQGLFHGQFEDKEYALAVYRRHTQEVTDSVYRRHTQEVTDSVPADKLLVWAVQEGWAPLCRFLGVTVPDAPFLHLSDAQAFRQRVLSGTAS